MPKSNTAITFSVCTDTQYYTHEDWSCLKPTPFTLKLGTVLSPNIKTYSLCQCALSTMNSFKCELEEILGMWDLILISSQTNCWPVSDCWLTRKRHLTLCKDMPCCPGLFCGSQTCLFDRTTHITFQQWVCQPFQMRQTEDTSPNKSVKWPLIRQQCRQQWNSRDSIHLHSPLLNHAHKRAEFPCVYICIHIWICKLALRNWRIKASVRHG